MNIIHLNTYDTGGSAKAAYSFHCLLKSNGFQSKMLVFKKRELIDDDIIGFRLNLKERIIHYKNELLRKWKSRNIKKKYYFFNVDETIDFPTSYLVKRLPFKPDVIVVHWVSGFVSAKNIYELSKQTGAKVLWRFNDLNAFTGGCHYNNGCLQYQNGCGNCPALSSNKLLDLSYKNYQQKIKWLSKTNITFISSTTQIDEELKSSLIAQYCKTHFILLSTNTAVFKPINKVLAAQKLNLPTNKKIIFFGAQYLNDERKGLQQLLEALHFLKKELTIELQDQILLVYACKDIVDESKFPFAVHKLEFLNTPEALALAYNAATVFVSPSTEDAGPMMIAESILCGTPVVAFDIGLAKDIIIDNVTGFMVTSIDSYKFAKAISLIIKMSREGYKKLLDNCINKSNNFFEFDREIKEIKNLLNV